MGIYDLDLYRAIRGESGSFVFSPYSIMDCITLAYDGMSEEAKAALCNAGVTPDVISSFAALDDKAKQMKSLQIANKIYVNKARTANFRTELIRSDASEQVSINEGTRLMINKWISGQTNGKIEDLIPAGAVTEEMAMLIANAVWMKQSWADSCDQGYVKWKADKKKYKAFEGSSDNTIARDIDGVTILRLSYDPEDTTGSGDVPSMSMYIVTEDRRGGRTPDEWIAAGPDLDATFNFGDYESLNDCTDVDYTVPCFKTEFKDEVIHAIRKIGLSDVLTGNAYKKIGDMAVDSIYHGAFIKVDENGTEAASATAEVSVLGLPPDYTKIVRRKIVVNRPFVFAIVEDTSRQILFMGRCDTDAMEEYTEDDDRHYQAREAAEQKIREHAKLIHANKRNHGDY